MVRIFWLLLREVKILFKYYLNMINDDICYVMLLKKSFIEFFKVLKLISI